MAFTKITASGIGSTETVTLDGLSVINDGSFGGNVSVGGTLTYEDVTNIDSVGLITARAGVVVGSGITLSKDGDGFFTGVVTATSYAGDGSGLTGIAATDNVRTGILDVAGVGTFRNDVNVPDKIIHLGDTNTAIRFPEADTVTAETGGTERLRINSTGQLLHGHNASIGLGRNFETSSTSGYGGIAINRFSADTGSGGLDFVKSRNASLGGNTIVQSGDNIGSITWRGADGTDFATPAAQIKVAVDGTPGSNDMPGRIMFHTTADGASSPTERLRIASDGKVTIKTASNATSRLLFENTGSVRTNYIGLFDDDDRIVIAADDADQGSGSSIHFKVDGTERMTIDSGGVISTPNSPYVIAGRGSTQSISNTTDTDIIFDSKSEDTHTNFDTSNGRFTCSVAGFYLVNLCVQYTGQINQMHTGIKLNNAALKTFYDPWCNHGDGTRGHERSVVIKCAVNDFITCSTYHSTGSTQSLEAGRTKLTIIKVG